MSQDAMIAFVARIRTDATLAGRMYDLAAEGEEAVNDVTVSRLAREAGFAVDPADAAAFRKRAREDSDARLSDESLEGVSGGAYSRDFAGL